MANHPNRTRRAINAPTYTPDQVVSARASACHTQAEAAATIYRTLRGWQDWEGGQRSVDAAAFELYLIKSGQSPL